MKLYIINFDNLGKYQRLIKKTLSTLNMRTKIDCVKKVHFRKPVIFFDLHLKK